MAANAARASAFAGALDRRKHYRADVAVGGRVLSERAGEQDCRTADISPGGARIISPAPPQHGENVVLYLDTLGRMPATVRRVDSAGGAFSVEFNISTHKREKLVEQLTWMMNKGLFAHDEDSRRHPRYDAAGSISVTFEDGGAVHCEVRDFSLVGCSLKTNHTRPPLGAWVRVGQSYGRVSRYLEDGFAVDFQNKPRAV